MKNDQNIVIGVKLRKIIIFLLFVCSISLPLLDYFLNLSGEYENTENRNKAPLPKIDINDLEPFPGKFDNYFNDNHNFRGELLSLNSYFKYNILSISPNKQVIEGKDGWLYRTDYLDTYTNKRLFTNIELDSFYVIFEKRSKWLESKNINHYIAIVPNKPQVYPEFLPDYIKKKNRTTKTEQFIETLQGIPNLKVIYLKDTLLSAKNSSPYDLYFKTDQHWNIYGAMVGYAAIVNEIKKDFPEISSVDFDNYSFDTTTTEGKDLAKTLMLHKSLKEVEIIVKPINVRRIDKIDTVKYPIPEVFPYKDSYQVFFYSSGKTLPKGLIIRDSFSSILEYKFPTSFGETTFIWDTWCYDLNENIVKQENPDFFLTIIIEVNLPYIIYKHPSMREDGFNAIKL